MVVAFKLDIPGICAEMLEDIWLGVQNALLKGIEFPHICKTVERIVMQTYIDINKGLRHVQHQLHAGMQAFLSGHPVNQVECIDGNGTAGTTTAGRYDPDIGFDDFTGILSELGERIQLFLDGIIKGLVILHEGGTSNHSVCLSAIGQRLVRECQMPGLLRNGPLQHADITRG